MWISITFILLLCFLSPRLSALVSSSLEGYFFSRGIQRFALSRSPRPGFSQGLQLAIDMRRQNGKRLQGRTRTSTKGRKFFKAQLPRPQGMERAHSSRLRFAKGEKIESKIRKYLVHKLFSSSRCWHGRSRSRSFCT